MTSIKLIYLTCAIVLSVALHAESINVNFGITLDDANAVDTGENSPVGISSLLTHDGALWNNVLLRSSGDGTPTSFTSASQSGSHIDLNDSSGTDAGVDMTSSGSFYANFSDASGANASATGDAGMMQSYALANSGETISLSGLSTWAPQATRFTFTLISVL